MGVFLLSPIFGAEASSIEIRAADEPIKIDSEREFLSMASIEGWSGDGSIFHPYIISGYVIDGSGYLWGIYIGNVSVYFIIENCEVYGVKSSSAGSKYHWGEGINLYNVTHGAVKSNRIHDNYIGIRIAESPSLSVYDNTCTRNSMGIYITSDYVRVSENTISESSQEGMVIEASHVTVEKNEMTGSDLLLYGSYASYGEYHNNTFSNGGFLISSFTAFTTQNISRDNLVNGKPVYYYKNVDFGNGEIPNDAGQVILGNVTNMKINEERIAHTAVAILIGYSSKIYISNSNFSYCEYGIKIHSSNGITVHHNTFYTGSEGIDMDTYGVYARDSISLTIYSNNFSYLWYSIKAVDSTTLSIYTNNFEHGIYGLDFRGVSGSKIMDNNYKEVGNSIWGGLTHSIIEGETIKNGSIYLTRVNNLTISDCHIQISTYLSGLTVGGGTDHIEIYNSNITVNGEKAIYIYPLTSGIAKNIEIHDNILSSGSPIISANKCENVKIYDNIIRNSHGSGIFFQSKANNSWIYSNKIENCSFYGVYMMGYHNTIYDNRFYYNHQSGDAYNSSRIQAYDSGEKNYWDYNGKGNYWQDWRGPDANHDGIVDEPYLIDGSANSQDNYPIAGAEIPEMTSLIIIGLIVILGIMRMHKNK